MGNLARIQKLQTVLRSFGRVVVMEAEPHRLLLHPEGAG